MSRVKQLCSQLYDCVLAARKSLVQVPPAQANPHAKHQANKGNAVSLRWSHKKGVFLIRTYGPWQWTSNILFWLNVKPKTVQHDQQDMPCVMPCSGQLEVDRRLRNHIASVMDILQESVSHAAHSQRHGGAVQQVPLHGAYLRPPLALYATCVCSNLVCDVHHL